MIQRWSGPTIQRTACGTISPTNEIGPARAVALPASSITATTASTRVRSTRAPRAEARSSPSAIAFSEDPMASAMPSPSSTNGPAT